MTAAPVSDPSQSPTWLGQTFDSTTVVRFPRTPTSNANAALALAEAGAFVFPVSQTKQPLVRWREVSTRDAGEIKRLWARFPGALIGLDCGKSGVVVIDADRHNERDDGVSALAKIVGDDLLALDAPLVRTPTGGGLHAYFMQPTGLPLSNRRGGLPVGLDVRGDGGFVVAPCSFRDDGAGWQPELGSRDLADALASNDLPPLPDAILRLLRQRPERPEPPRASVADPPRAIPVTGERERAFASVALAAGVAELAGLGAGGRNATLNAVAFRMGRQIGAGRIGRDEVERALESAAAANGLARDDGWPAVRATIRSGLDAGQQQPAEPLADREDWGAQDAALIAMGAETARALADGLHAAPQRETIRVDDVLIDAKTGEIVDGARPRDAGGDAQPRLELRAINAASFAGQPVPRQRWLIENFIPAANVGIVAGDGAVGKSLLALQLCVAVAVGGEWIGFHPAKGKALYVSCEDEEPELHRRLDRLWPDLDALADLDLIDLAGRDAVMAAPDRAGLLKPTGLYTAIRHLIATRRPDLIVLDNLSDTFGGDELKRVHARQFVALMRALALDFDTTILILQHPSQSGLASGTGTSGSTGWSNGVRTRLFLERRTTRDGNTQTEAEPDLRVLSMKKSNRSPMGDQIVIRWQDGRFIREEQTNLNVRDAAQHAKRTFLKLLRLHTKQNRNLSAQKSSTYAPAVFERHPGAEGVSGAAFARAMEHLFDEARISVEEVGSPSKRRQRLVIVRREDEFVEPETFPDGDDGQPSRRPHDPGG